MRAVGMVILGLFLVGYQGLTEASRAERLASTQTASAGRPPASISISLVGSAAVVMGSILLAVAWRKS